MQTIKLNDPVVIRGTKYRVYLIHHGVAEVRMSFGKTLRTLQIKELAFDKVAGVWRRL